MLLLTFAFRNSICFLKSSNSLQERPYCRRLFSLYLLPISRGINQPHLHRAGTLLSEVSSALLSELCFAVLFKYIVFESIIPWMETKSSHLAWISLVQCSPVGLVTHNLFLLYLKPLRGLVSYYVKNRKGYTHQHADEEIYTADFDDFCALTCNLIWTCVVKLTWKCTSLGINSVISIFP